MYRYLHGLVLQSFVSAEADKIITLYTREEGKLSVVVPGAKKIIAKHAAASEPVTESRLMVYASSDYARPKVTGAVVREGFFALRSNWRALFAAQCCAELCAMLTPARVENTAKYDLLFRTWQLMQKADRPARIFAAYALRFLKLSGYNFIEFVRREDVRLAARDHDALIKFSSLRGEDVDACEDILCETEKMVLEYICRYVQMITHRPLPGRHVLQTMTVATLMYPTLSEKSGMQ